MTSVVVKIAAQKAAPAENTVIRKVRGYGHADIADLFGLDTNLTGPNFNHVNYYHPGGGGFSAVTNFYKSVDYAYLMKLQPNPSRPVENWLIGDVTAGGKPSRPLWWDLDNQGQRLLRCGSSVFGENVVAVDAVNGKPTVYYFWAAYPGRTKEESIPFHRVRGLKPSEMGKVTHQSHPWLIHRCNQANEGNVIDWYPKGETIYYPVWDPMYWQMNTGVTAIYIPAVMFYS